MQNQNDAAIPPKGTGNKRVIILASILALIIFTTLGRMWWRSHYYVETNNAYITGHIHPVSSRVEGVVTHVLIQDNQFVKEGTVIAQLSPTDQLIKIEQIHAQINSAQHQLQQAVAQITQAKAQANSAVAQVSQAQAQSLRAQQDAQRYEKLYNDKLKAISKSDLDATHAERSATHADVLAHEHAMSAAQAQILSAESQHDIVLAHLKLLSAQLKEAELQLSYHQITSPVAGRIGKRSLEVGMRVQPGKLLVAIVQDKIWVTANFKETQFTKLHRGQLASISLDALPGHTFKGRIESFAPASGSEFSLLPPDNATGNFTKIVKRIPVKIVLAPEQIKTLHSKLLPGMSATVEVDLASS